jgi:hypothetical protein
MESDVNPNSRLVGVRGWLLFLVIVLVLVSPVFALVTASEYAKLIQLSATRMTPVAVWSFYVVRALAYISAGLCLFFWKRSTSPRYAIFILWIAGPVSVWLWQNAMHSFSARSVATACAPAILWTAYLLVSKRVKNTYQ